MADTIPEQIERAAVAVKSLSDAIPVYKDAVQPLAREAGKIGETVGKTINALLIPLRGLVWGFDRIEQYLHQALPGKLQAVPRESLQTPPAYVAVPVIESLRYTAEQPVLRDMYLNLLATAMDARTVGSAHPAFSEIIRQLTPDEARIIDLFGRVRTMPVVWFRTDTCTEQFSQIKEQAGIDHAEFFGLYVANLHRLNLVSTTDPSRTPAARATMMALATSPAVLARKQAIERCTGENVRLQHGEVSLTDLGRTFVRVVLPHTP